MAEGWRGIDLNEEMDNIVSEFTESTEGIEEGGSKQKRKLHVGIPGFIKKPITWIAASVILLLLIGGFWLLKPSSNTSKSVSNSDTSQTAKMDSSKPAYKVFTQGIKQALNANDVKNQVASDWRAATVKYGETNDLEEFKATLVKINETRKKALEAIPEDDYDINRYMIETLNAQKDYLNKAYSATSSEEAIAVYNEWSNNVNVERDNQYIEILIVELDKVGIPYQKSENDGSLSVTF